MKTPEGYRKRIHHYDEPGHARELTFSCYKQMPLLVNDAWLAMLAMSVDHAIEGHKYRLAAFVFMPEHVHMIVCPEDGADGIDALLKAVKRPFSYRIKQILVESGNPLLDSLTVQQRPGVTTFRFWQEGPGYDRNLVKASTTRESINYLHNNPIRRGLVQSAVDWKWSSARYYLVDPPTQKPGGPHVHGLPAEWWDER
jgi:putative transposase